MQQISSSWTLLVRIFFPTFWLAFFGALTLAVVRSADGELGGFNTFSFKIGMVVAYLAGIFVFWQTAFRLLRLEGDATHLFVTNYLKSAKYPLTDIEKMEVRKYPFLSLIIVELKGKGMFGQRLVALKSPKKWQRLVEKYPHWADFLQH